jgi:ABC-2 type transport system permease protein
MTWILWRKLLRDVRWSLLAVALLLGLFQMLWAHITARILGEFSPFFNSLASLANLTSKDIESVVFSGPGQVMRTIIGGDRIALDQANDMLTIGYVHPVMVITFCIWAIGRAAGAIAGEIDRGTMELLMAQPIARSRIILAHFLVDCVTIPALCLSLYLGNVVGAAMVSPIQIKPPTLQIPQKVNTYILEVGPVKLRLADPFKDDTNKGEVKLQSNEELLREKLRIDTTKFLPGLVLVGGLIFAVTGCTMWLSAAGRFRWRVLGLAVFIFLVQFLLNLLGGMWDTFAWVQPLTIFYYYQPQPLILFGEWNVALFRLGETVVRVPTPLILFGTGFFGYAMALRTLTQRDLPAPL